MAEPIPYLHPKAVLSMDIEVKVNKPNPILSKEKVVIYNRNVDAKSTIKALEPFHDGPLKCWAASYEMSLYGPCFPATVPVTNPC